MSKADELRKKMNKSAVPTFIPRQSVAIQPMPQSLEEVTKKATSKPSKPVKVETTKEEIELVALFARVPKDDKKWLDHYRIDEGRDLGDVVSEAIQLLKKQAASK